ncbi:MAG: type I-U CRISPR-associated helicase/endonuclease Cas3 [Candidatus Accumulibacter sp. UW27]|jgi:CRISPR-associated endonuclease/helicase Cas3
MMEFEEFFRHVSDHAPFPWQCSLARQLSTGCSLAVTVPTGLGKSAVIDAAVWAALAGGWRRIVFVVDRRLVVDEVHERALRIEAALRDKPELAVLHDKLGELQVVRLRGGLFGDDDWVLYPERLSIVLSTVDQVGSRLLGRGYGVSPRRWPLHAGFFSSRTLIVVDEAHLSSPFLHTLDTLRRSGADMTVLPMSATLHDKGENRLGLTAADHAHPLIAQRLGAHKFARLVAAADDDTRFSRQALVEAGTLGLGQAGRKLAIIVNRVATARSIHEALKKAGERSILLIGRSRNVDRERLLQGYLPELRSGRDRQADERPLCVVATQTVEVGADFDFDGIVSECASLSALRQRLGRLDRLGELGESRVVILHRSGKKADPVYGTEGHEAWEWLQRVAQDGVVDLGLAALDATLALNPAPFEKPAAVSTLLPAHLHLLAQSGPYAPRVEIAPWLHGPQRRQVDVTLVWRADLDEVAEDKWCECLAAMPPMRGESLDMPLPIVRRWMQGAARADETLSDMESSAAEEEGSRAPGDAWRMVRWRGPDDSQLVDLAEIRPGDTLVLPASRGGCDEWGWAPESREAVPDRAEDCRFALEGGRRATTLLLRLTPERISQYDDATKGLAGAVSAVRQARLELDASLEEDRDSAEVQWGEALAGLRAQISDSRNEWLQKFGRDYSLQFYPAGLLLRGSGVEEEEGILETGVAVPLAIHHADVARWTQALSGAHDDAGHLIAAAALHDKGKEEARMQVMLHGDVLAAAAGPILAKSAQRTPADRKAAYFASGLPRGFRHELASLLYANPQDALVRHLVGSHHGYGRPWFQPCADARADGAAMAVLGSGWVGQFGDQLAKYGLWGLAQREWLLRAADARASIEEAEGAKPCAR